MKKIFSIFLVLFIMVSFSCKNSHLSEEKNNVKVPVLAGIMAGRSSVSLKQNWDNETILTDGFSPVVTGLTDKEIDIDLTEEGSMYEYQENTLGGATVNITVQLVPYWRFDEDKDTTHPYEPADGWDLVYVYAGAYNENNEYYSYDEITQKHIEGFLLIIYRGSDNITRMTYWQEFTAEYVENDELISQYKIYVRMSDIALEGDGSTFDYSTTENVFAAYYAYNKLEVDSHEDYAFSNNCNITKNSESFVITLKDVISSYRQGPRLDNSYLMNDNSFIDQLSTRVHEEDSNLAKYASGEDNGVVMVIDGVTVYSGYLSLSPFILNPVIDSITFTKTF